MSIIVYLFSAAGCLACYIGVFVTMCISLNIATAVYIEMKELSAAGACSEIAIPADTG